MLVVSALLLICTSSFAATVEDAVSRVVSKLLIETAVDQRILLSYKDWFYIDTSRRKAMAGALTAGVICPEDGLLNPKGNDLSPLIRGLVRFGIESTAFEVKDLSNDPTITLLNDTLYLIDGEIKDSLDDYANCYAMVNRDNKAFVVWRDVKTPVHYLYEGKLFLIEGQKVILTEGKKYINGFWEPFSQSKYTDVILGENVQVVLNGKPLRQEDVILNHLDSKVYFLGNPQNEVMNGVHIELISEWE